jgi:hypothetical protein
MRAVGGAGIHLRAEILHDDAAVRLLLVADFDHIDFQVNVEEVAGHGQRAAPLARAGLSGQRLGSSLLIVEGYSIVPAE